MHTRHVQLLIPTETKPRNVEIMRESLQLIGAVRCKALERARERAYYYNDVRKI